MINKDPEDSIPRFNPEVDSYERPFMHPSLEGDYIKYEDHLVFVEALKVAHRIIVNRHKSLNKDLEDELEDLESSKEPFKGWGYHGN